MTFLSKYLVEEDLEKLMTNSLNQLNSIQTRYAPKQGMEIINLTIHELRNYFVDYIKTIYEQIDTHKIEGNNMYFKFNKSYYFFCLNSSFLKCN